MKSMHISRCMMLFFLCCFPSCIKYYDFVKSEFPQAKQVPDMRQIAQAYCQSATVYDQFQTKALFDVLWLSDQLRTAYSEVYSVKRGLTQEAKEENLRRQLEENRHWICFYILADIRDKTYMSLSEPHAYWTLYVKLDDEKLIVPETIKEVDLEPEYQKFFGSHFNLFKTAYIVKFPLSEELARCLALNNVHEVKLTIRSIEHECTITWNENEIKNLKKVKRDEDIYWS